jgi:hypothetical protein
MAEVISLAREASEAQQTGHLRRGFNALRDDVELERIRDGDDGACEVLLGATGQVIDERLGDLQDVDRQTAKSSMATRMPALRSASSFAMTIAVSSTNIDSVSSRINV